MSMGRLVGRNFKFEFTVGGFGGGVCAAVGGCWWCVCERSDRDRGWLLGA